MFNNENNGGGNPNHDEKGRFTSGGNSSNNKKEDASYEDKIKNALGIKKASSDDKLSNNFDKTALKKEIMDKFKTLNDEQKKDFALNVFNYGTEGFDNPLGKFRDPYTGEIMYADSSNDYSDISDYLLNSENELSEALDRFIDDKDANQDYEKLFEEFPVQDLEKDEEENDSNDNSNDISDDEIRESLADSEWTITGKETVGDYVQGVADKLGVPKDRVFNVLKGYKHDVSENDSMAEVLNYDRDDDYEEKIKSTLGIENKGNALKQELEEMSNKTDNKYGITLSNAVKDLKKYPEDSLLGDERAINQLMNRFGLSRRDVIRYLNYAFDGKITDKE